MSTEKNDITIEKILQKIERMNVLAENEFDRIRNTESRRKKLLQYLHYCHIARMWGGLAAHAVDDEKEHLAVEELKTKINHCSDMAQARDDVLKMKIINDHTYTWYIARYYYEKCSKILCQMMATIMDTALEGETGISILYTEEEKKKSPVAEREIAILSNNFRDSYYYMCAHDYCTERLAGFAGIEEYSVLIPEHSRIVKNGLPARLVNMVGSYKKIKKDTPIELNEALSDPESLYDRELLDKLYAKITNELGGAEAAMSNYTELVRIMDYAYTYEMKKRTEGANGRVFNMEGDV